ncbi:hypothetical protein GCM10011519_05710 [Marmoricola endophyticus]|uniref:Uncharacterized protein n=1 Tax=Marmoricola endophyticus TaxID=2040280 RepID=A0A917EYU0_9ACTN|nr:hypothetical protein [Marmoricola endophyticus]GGF35124.1 hypothetical protein GCM10011519_05710 [Marmoricola endophyticus]
MIVERLCPRCGTAMNEVVPRPAGRPRRWCSARCRRAASEERRAAAAGAIGKEFVPVELSLEEHVRIVLDSPKGCRRVLRGIRERTKAGLLTDARWDGVKGEIDRIRFDPVPRPRWADR